MLALARAVECASLQADASKRSSVGVDLVTAIHAANVIKRSMRFNRDRVFNAIMTHGSHVSKDVLTAYLCIYAYTKDVSGCLATMGNDYSLAFRTREHEVQDNDTLNAPSVKAYVRHVDRIATQASDEWSSKKTFRIIYQTCPHPEILVAVNGWIDRVDKDYIMWPEKYLPRLRFIDKKNKTTSV